MMAKRQGVAPDCAGLWDEEKHARHCWDTIQELGDRRTLKTLSDLHVRSHSRVLDIGAGPGTLAVPLSGRVSQVTAVEPSPGMMAVLQANLFDRRIGNTTCIQKRWEEVDADNELDGPFDTVIAAFSLDMPDIQKAIQKMIGVCTGHVYLYWFAGVPTWTTFYKAIWPQLHGTPYKPSPKFRVLIGVLKQMSINPHVEFIPTPFPIRFRSMDDAIEEISPEFNVQTGPQRETLARFLERILVTGRDSLVLPHFYMAAKVWWKTTAHV